MNRRLFLAGGAAAIAAAATKAQGQGPPGKVARVGIFGHSAPPTAAQIAASPLRLALRETGWIEGQTILFESLYTGGDASKLPELAAEFVRRRVDLIWCNAPPATIAAARATNAIPIVFWGVAFPVEQGLVRSLAKPGGNVTGFAFSAGPEVATKLLETLKAMAPTARRIAWISGLSAVEHVQGHRVSVPAFEDSFLQSGMEVRRFFLESREDVSRVLSNILEWRASGVFVFGDPATFLHRQTIVDFAVSNRLPGAFGMKPFTLAGGLFSYGADVTETMRRSAHYVDRILKGVPPSDLPVELPTKFELVINMKAARAMGLTVPAILQVRADELLE